MNYGIPFQGSKSKIAKEIIRELPRGKRLIDLFGGGFAISHCALLSGKWECIYYNDIDPLIIPLIKNAINGNYSYEVFHPEFINREQFNRLKNIDGYVKYIWSFGNNGRDYLFGKDIEDAKEELHNYVVFGKESKILNGLVGYNSYLPYSENDPQETLFEINHTNEVTERRLYLKKILRMARKRIDLEQLQQLQQLERLQQLEQLEQLQQLEQLERLQQLEQLVLYNHDYREYQYIEGDVVYCDIPYEGTCSYQGNKFNHTEFYEWAKSRPYPVYFSSYEISDKTISFIWEMQRRSTYSAQNNNVYRNEKLYLTGKTITQCLNYIKGE